MSFFLSEEERKESLNMFAFICHLSNQIMIGLDVRRILNVVGIFTPAQFFLDFANAVQYYVVKHVLRCKQASITYPN